MVLLKTLHLFLVLIAQPTQKQADIVEVQARSIGESYTFYVTISSPDTGCDQYADWWEVISEDGELLYRRILLHSHISEQPFKRSGGPVKLDRNQRVWIRAHMNNTGYGGQVFVGSAKDGFKKGTIPADLGLNLDKMDPLPQGCTG